MPLPHSLSRSYGYMQKYRTTRIKNRHAPGVVPFV
jgi:hypothetical protein